MKNNTQEDYVTFEIVKLLKEKGFDTQTNQCHLTKNNEGNYFAPTTALVIKWLRENFNWNVEIGYRNSFKDYRATIYPIFPNTMMHFVEKASTYEEAESAAILYTLKHLI
ncbi:MAG: hypothetical protein ABIP51_21535 [Bacteroidia bacterium]